MTALASAIPCWQKDWGIGCKRRERDGIMLEWLWNMVFPPKCPGCLHYMEKRGEWCSSCLDRLCRPHLLPLAQEMREIFSSGVWALGMYEQELRSILKQLKYRQKMGIVPYIHSFVAEGLAKSVRDRHSKALFDRLAVPVPLHKEKLSKRGFNQSQLIFQKPLESLGLSMEDVLLRTRATEPQYGLGAEQRRENLHQAFAMSEGKSVQGCRILLVDDIMTTGTTLLECGRVLKNAGAADIMGLVAASGRK